MTMKVNTSFVRQNWRAIGFFVVLFLAFITIVIASHLPIYTDEVQWKLQQARTGFDGFQTTITVPSCGQIAVDVPLADRPFRLFETALYQNLSSPHALRLWGLGIGIGWAIVAWALLHRTLPSSLSRYALGILVIGLSTIGVMPFFLAFSRPEQVLLVVMTCFAIPLITDARSPRRTFIADVAIAVLTVAAACYMLSSHPRAVFALPLCLLFMMRISKRRAICATAAAVTVAFSGVAVTTWGNRETCDDPALRDTWLKESLLTAVHQHRVPDYIHLWLKSLREVPAKVFYVSQFKLDGYFTAAPIPRAHWKLATPISDLATYPFALVCLLGFLTFIYLLFRAVRSRTITMPILALGSLWAFYFASIVARVEKPDYESTVMEPVMAMAALGSLWVGRRLFLDRLTAPRIKIAATAGLAAFLTVCVLDEIAFIMSYTPPAMGSWSHPGYPYGQPFSVSTAGYDSLRPQIMSAASKCGIDPSKHPHQLIVDELTYFSMEPAFQPHLALYIDEKGWGRGIPDIQGFLTKLGSDGMIARCSWIPSKVKSMAIDSGTFCCLPSFAPALRSK